MIIQLSTLSCETLGTLALAFKFLGAAFYAPPAETLLASLRDEDLLSDWLLPSDDANTAQGLGLLRTFVVSADLPGLLNLARTDYNALFLGPDALLAPPWESVYLSPEHLLWDDQTLGVRAAYAHFGLQIPRLDREPDDHIGFELLFLSHLCDQAADALEKGLVAEANKIVAAARDFLHAHTQRWAGLFAERVTRSARTDYYRGLAYLLSGSLSYLDAALAEDGTPA